jgi:hypothetical protein
MVCECWNFDECLSLGDLIFSVSIYSLFSYCVMPYFGNCLSIGSFICNQLDYRLIRRKIWSSVYSSFASILRPKSEDLVLKYFEPKYIPHSKRLCLTVIRHNRQDSKNRNKKGITLTNEQQRDFLQDHRYI